MPDTGYDPYGGFTPGAPIDMSGGGEDPGYYYSLAPGSPFPGATANYLGYRSGASVGNAGGSGEKPGHIPLGGALGRLGNFVLWNNATGGPGQQPSGPGGYPYQFWSGPGAAYGPASGPGTGLVDMGRPVGSIWDGAEQKPPGSTDSSPGTTKKPGGGGHHQTFNLQPYQGLRSTPQFVEWNPTPYGARPNPSIFSGGGPSSTPGPAPLPVTRKPPHGGSGAGSGASGGGGRPSGGQGAAPGTVKPGSPVTPPGSIFDPANPPGWHPQAKPTPDHGQNSTFGGVDSNYLDFMTPSWTRDPTTGIMNTSGFPGSTLTAPQSGGLQTEGGQGTFPAQTFDSYMAQLHDQGLSNDEIMSMVGRYGYQQDSSGNWQWNWGTGPVVGNPGGGGYQFARGASGGGGGQDAGKPNTSDNLAQGWTLTQNAMKG
jgi:hypothetical protein